MGRGGQGSFPEVIEELLSPIEFGSDLHASIWRPAEGVWLNPKIQAGAPCVDGTRVPTRAIADLEAAGRPHRGHRRRSEPGHRPGTRCRAV